MNFINFNLGRITKIQFFLIFCYSICWLSISTDFNDLLPFLSSKYQTNESNTFTFFNIVNFLRQLLNILIFPILIFLFFRNFNMIKIKDNFIFFIFVIYFLFQIPGLILYQNSFLNFVYLISAINILLILQLSNDHFYKDRYIIFSFISFLMLVLITTLNYKTFVNFIYTDSRSLYTFFTSSETFFGKNSPRSTGSSRTFLLIFIISLIIFQNFLRKKNAIKNIIFVTIATIILLFQSRTTIVLLIVFIILNYWYESPNKIYEKFKYFFIHFVLPIIVLFIILFLKNLPVIQKNLIENNVNGDVGLILDQNTIKVIKDDFKRPVDPKSYSSGRFEDWKNLYYKIKDSPLIGYGSQGDRFLINQSASNGIFYALSSSGLFGFFFYIIISLYCLTLIVKKIVFQKKRDTKSYLCSIILLIILLRSVLESSYAVFGVDFIIFSSFLFYLNQLNKKNEN